MRHLKSLVVSVAAWLLAGCAWFSQAPPPDKPEVSVKDGKIAVAPDPLDFTGRPGEVTITWRLPDGSPHTFGDNGIVIEDSKEPRVPAREEFVDCKPGDKGKTFICRNLHKGKGRHKYTVYVRDGERQLPPHDPFIHN